jgi:hypothetical protein
VKIRLISGGQAIDIMGIVLKKIVGDKNNLPHSHILIYIKAERSFESFKDLVQIGKDFFGV